MNINGFCILEDKLCSKYITVGNYKMCEECDDANFLNNLEQCVPCTDKDCLSCELDENTC